MKKKRPTLITILCIIGFFGSSVQFLSNIFNFLPVVSGLTFMITSTWYKLFNMFMALMFFVSLTYIWKMKKNGLIFFTILSVINEIFWVSVGYVSYFSLVATGIVLSLFYTKFKLMD